MGTCQYRFNPTEIYQMTLPGRGVETICGGRTFAACDEPEIRPVTIHDPDGTARTEHRHTGNWLPRGTADPYCPAHGGTPEPPEPDPTWDELQAQGQRIALERQSWIAALERAGVELPVALQATRAIEAQEVRSDVST